uniref:Putative serine proteinase inhibitor ku family n=1 Tax=Amblyomma tuberculatum TaxID=48802 RepID=A0A6M2E411_9ACAR
MSLLAFLLTGCALVASVTGGSRAGQINQRCTKPEFPQRANCNTVRLKYFYNKTSRNCAHFRWASCQETGVFNTLYHCVSVCKTGQGAPFCASPPMSRCPEEEISKGRERYYYDIMTRTCKTYFFCGERPSMFSNNYFISAGYCQKQCGGFNETTAKGKTEQYETE